MSKRGEGRGGKMNLLIYKIICFSVHIFMHITDDDDDDGVRILIVKL